MKTLSPPQIRVLFQQLELSDVDGVLDTKCWGYADNLPQKGALLKAGVVEALAAGGPFRVRLFHGALRLACPGAIGLIFRQQGGWAPLVDLTPEDQIYLGVALSGGERVAVARSAVARHIVWEAPPGPH